MIRTRPIDFINRRVGVRFPNYSNLSQGITSRVNPPGQGPNFLSNSPYPGLAPTALTAAGLGMNPSGEMYNVGRPSFTPSASTLPTDYNPSSQMYWMAPGYQSRPVTGTQQRLLNSPIYEAGPNLSQEGKDVAALWGIDLSEKPEGWNFRPISYQEFYGKPTPTDMLGGETASIWEADKSGQNDPEYAAYLAGIAEQDRIRNSQYQEVEKNRWYDPTSKETVFSLSRPVYQTPVPGDYLSYLLMKRKGG